MSKLSLVIVLAAGDSKRMKSKQSKVLHKIAGRSVIENLLSSIKPLSASNLTVVVGANKDEVVAITDSDSFYRYYGANTALPTYQGSL